MKKKKKVLTGLALEALLYPFLLLIVLWVLQGFQSLADFPVYKLGVIPRRVEGLPGIFLMPLIHSPHDIKHIINNSLPIYFLFAALIYYYREIAVRIMSISWLGTGLLVWVFAPDKGSWHIGISGVIYALAFFLFFSGVLRKYLPLQAISLFVALYYGSMIWGIFPLEEAVSWEGHFAGMAIGLFFAFYFKNIGPVRPKFQYEIEKDLGIEPPDLEGMWNARMEELKRQEEEEERLREQIAQSTPIYIYHYVKKDDLTQPDKNAE